MLSVDWFRIRHVLLRRIRYKVTRGGVLFTLAVVLVAFAAVASANNLLFLILATMLSTLMVSGLVSRLCLAGLELDFLVPEHVAAGRTIPAKLYVRNLKFWMPSLSIQVVGVDQGAPPVLQSPVYFPVIPGGATLEETVQIRFARRGEYRQNHFAFHTRFPFGFLEKAARVVLRREVIVYPCIDAQAGFEELLADLAGEIETHYRGLGRDFYRIRPYEAFESARHVDWKATARTGELKVREFAREDERQVVLVFDPLIFAGAETRVPDAEQLDRFERGVKLAACLAWHFYEINAEIEFRTEKLVSPMAPSSETIWSTMRELALIQPRVAAPGESLLAQLPEEPHLFKIILTAQPRGTIPTQFWTTAYVIFM